MREGGVCFSGPLEAHCRSGDAFSIRRHLHFAGSTSLERRGCHRVRAFARLFAGRSTLWYDPYSRDKPSLAGHNEISAPVWAELAYPFPLRQMDG